MLSKEERKLVMQDNSFILLSMSRVVLIQQFNMFMKPMVLFEMINI